MWDFDFQGHIVDPLSWSAIDYAAFANAASVPFGVIITADDVSAMTPQQRVDYLQTLDEFLDGYYSDSYSQGGDQNSNYTDYSDAAPLGQEFLQTFGWMTGIQQLDGYHYWDYLTQDIDPEFLQAINSAEFNNFVTTGSSGSYDLSQILLFNAALSGASGFQSVWVPGTPTHWDGGDIVVTAGHWEIRAPTPTITYGNLNQQGDGSGFLTAALGVTEALSAFVDTLVNEVVVDPSVTLTQGQKQVVADFKALVTSMAGELAKIPDDAVLTLPGIGTVTGSEAKQIWARADFQIYGIGHVYANGTTRGEANFNGGNPTVSFNIDTLVSYSNKSGGLAYLVLHELGHMVETGRDYYNALYQGGFTSAENQSNERFANTVAHALADYAGLTILLNPTYGYDPSYPEFIVPAPTSGGDGGGEVYDPNDLR